MLGVGFSLFTLAVNQRTTAGVAPVPTPGDALSFTVRDSTPFDLQDKTGSSGIMIGPNGNGWVAELIFKGMTTGGTFDATKVTLTVTDPGFDSSGNATTRTRLISGGKVLRQQAPNQATSAIYTSGSDVRVQFSLTDTIYAGSTITAVSVAAGAYGASNAGSLSSIVNSSTVAYPKPLFAWLNLPYERVASNSMPVEAYALHGLARNGRQVAAIRYTATDGTNTTTAISSSAALSTLLTKGKPPECYPATLDISGLTQGAACTVNAQVYPWIGDAASVLNLATDGVALPTSNMQALLPFLCDRTGGYGGAFAYVKVGATGGSVSATAATARAAPYPTMGAAITAVAAWNNTNKAHNNVGGATIRLMDDGASGAVQHVITGSSAAVGACWYDVQPDPLAVGAVSLASGGSVFIPELVRFSGGLQLVVPTGSSTFFILTNDATNGRVALDNCAEQFLGTRAAIDFARRCWHRNVTFTGSVVGVLMGSSTEPVAVMGCDGTALTAGYMTLYRTVIGCDFRYAQYTTKVPSSTWETGDGGIFANNRIIYSGAITEGTNYTISRGFGFTQNVAENGGSTLVVLGADGTSATINNLLEMHNTVPGERGNRMYNDVDACAVAPSGVQKRGFELFSIWNNWNNKQDCFPGSTLRGRVGGWECAWGVNRHGFVSIYGSKQGTVPAASDHYLGEYWNPDSLYSATTQATVPTFANNQTPGFGAGVGGGDYHLTGTTNSAYNRVSVGAGVFAYDLDGVARKNDGTGAAGAYERTL